MRIIFYATFIIYLISGCSQKQPPNPNLNFETINVSPIDSNRLTKYLKKMRLVRLETTPECLIGNINKIEYINERFYVLDSETTKSLFIFNSSGKFLFKISKVGKGPGEFIQPKDFLINEENCIEILDTDRRYILKYNMDGVFISEKNFGLWVDKFAKYSNDYLFTVNNKPNRDGRYNFLVLNSEFNLKEQQIPFLKNQESMKFSLNKPFSTFSNEISLIYPFNDTVYYYNKGRLNSRYVLNFGKNQIPKNFIGPYPVASEIVSRLKIKEYAFAIDNLCEVKDLLYFRFVINNNVYSTYYSKKSKKVMVYNHSQFNDLLSNFLPIANTDDDEFMGVVSSYDLKQSMKISRNKKSDKEWGELMKDDKLRGLFELSEKVSDLENPILFLMKIDIDL